MSLNERIFAVMTELCQAASGDGDAFIVSEDYKKLADEYEIWVNNSYPNKYTKSQTDNVISFYDREESIFFCDENFILPIWASNILKHPWMN